MPGTEKQFSAFNYLVPATGTVSGFNVQTDFSTVYTKNFGQLAIDSAEFHPSGVFIDNTAGKSTLTITIQETGQNIVTPAGGVKQVQYPAPINHTVTVKSASAVAGNGIASVTFVDFPVMPFESKLDAGVITAGLSTHGTVDATGAQVVIPAGEYAVHTTVQNTDAANKLYLSFTNPATVNDFVLSPGQAMTFPNNGFSNPLYGLSNAVTTAFATIGA